MGNFVKAFELGKTGQNKGLTTGIRGLDKAINGINKKSIYNIASAPKVGKSTLADYSFMLSPYLEWLDLKEKNGGIEPYPLWFVYFSYEVDRVQKEFKFAAFFMYKDHGILRFMYNGEYIEMSADYLQGKQLDKNGVVVPVSPEHEDFLKTIYRERIIPLFGEYDENGDRVSYGKVLFIEQKTNPTGIRNDLIHNFFLKYGKHIMKTYQVTGPNGQETRETPIAYIPDDPNARLIIFLDHVRKVPKERGFNMKDNIDKTSEYFVEMRNFYGATFVVICHSNRNLADPNRKKDAGQHLFITADDIKDSGNLSEDSDYVLTIFNPNDEKYALPKHFGVDLLDPDDNQLHPNYRSIHLVESRHTKCPVHIQTEMYGGCNLFLPLNLF